MLFYNAQVVVEEEDEDDEVLALKDRLAAYNLDSSPDKSAGMLIIFLLSNILLMLIDRCYFMI